MLLLRRGPKAPCRARTAPQPSAGARRRGTERPELLVIYIIYIIYAIVFFWTPPKQSLTLYNPPHLMSKTTNVPAHFFGAKSNQWPQWHNVVVVLTYMYYVLRVSTIYKHNQCHYKHVANFPWQHWEWAVTQSLPDSDTALLCSLYTLFNEDDIILILILILKNPYHK